MGINDLIEISTYDDWVVESLGGGIQNSGMNPDWQKIVVKKDNPDNVHATESVDTKQIENANLRKLRPVLKIDRLTDEKINNK